MSDAATVILARYVRPGFEMTFEDWAASVAGEVKGVDAGMAFDLVRPQHPVHPDYILVLRFTSPQRRQAWEESPECRAWLEKGEPMIAGKPEVHFLSRLEPWVHLPGATPPKLPPRWKIAALTFFALLPLVWLIFPRVASIPLALAACVLLYAYASMPTLTRLFSWWLLTAPDKDKPAVGDAKALREE